MKKLTALQNDTVGAVAVWITWAVVILLGGGCATTDEQRFPLDYMSGREATYQPDTAREALPAYQRMGADLERQGRYGEATIAYANAWHAARVLGRLQEALEAARKAVEMAERSGNPVQLRVALNRLGYSHLSLNALQEAMASFDRAASLRGVAKENPGGQASSYYGLSQAYRRLRNPELAATNAMKAIAIMEAALQAKGMQWSSARDGGRRLRNLEAIYVQALWEAGHAYRALGQTERARETFSKMLEVASGIHVPRLIAQAHIGLGMAAADQKDWRTAADHLEGASRLNPMAEALADIHGRLGQAYRQLGNLPQAESALRQAVAGFEDLRGLLGAEDLREAFFETKAETYELLALTLVDQGKTGAAFDVNERGRARAFLDLLGNRVTLSAGRNPALIAEERALQERISALRAQAAEGLAQHREFDRAREAYQTFLQRVRQADREQASLMTVEPLTLVQVQALLPEGAVLLEYCVTAEGKTLLWSVERNGVFVRILPFGRRGIADRVQAFRTLIASRGQEAETQRLAQELFNQLVRPGLRGRTPTELLIVPNGPLHYLPFQALMPAPDRYLIQDVPIAYYSSASLMQFTRAKAQPAPSTLFALGNPNLHDPTLNLRYAEREVRAIGDLFPGGAVLTKEQATKFQARAQSPQYTVLHFATHAELDDADPMGTALRLSPGPKDDGRLDVQEIFGLDLKANLVVLSACETALGKLTRGDELTGLTRAFICAGTPSIITTLWQVNDRASYEMMGDFYRQLKAGKDKAEALRQAQLATLRGFPHPYYWAAYQLTGEAR